LAAVPAWPFAVAALPVGFLVADLTGVRPVGGLVLFALATAALFFSRTTLNRRIAWVAVLAGCFAASHALADVLGTWGAVGLVTVVTGAAGYVLLEAS
jgi:hypothetical protein